MRCAFWLVLLFAVPAWADQPYGIRLNPSGVSYIYPVVDSKDWLLTQPDVKRMYTVPDYYRVTHWEDEYYAQDWARGCGSTYGQRLYAGISGVIVYAGWRGPYGNTVVVYDQDARFALKYSHLSEIAVQKGEWVLAGKSFIGRIGNTGNIRSVSCSSDPGSHLHLALFKNVTDPEARPIVTTSAKEGNGPSLHAAPFTYASSVDLVRTRENPTVFALWQGIRLPVSAGSFESHGWNFDKYQAMFNPVRFVGDSEIRAVPALPDFWPLRDYSLLKSSNSSTVYQFEDGRKMALTLDVFNCRGLRFGEVREVNPGERDSYQPVSDQAAAGCEGVVRRVLRDLQSMLQLYPGFQGPYFSSYLYDPHWGTGWELRLMKFRHASGFAVSVHHATNTSAPKERYVGFNDPYSGQWTGWQRIN